MPPIARDSLLSLEAYARERKAFRARAIEHKQRRTVALGDHVTLLFEDELTVRYQIQEMLRIERIFEEEGIRGELDAYNPLVPDGTNWKATMLLEYPDVEERRRRLAELKGIERQVWVQVAGCERVMAIADEDLERENEEKTASVHFLRFELTPEMRQRVEQGDLGFRQWKRPMVAGGDVAGRRQGIGLSQHRVRDRDGEIAHGVRVEHVAKVYETGRHQCAGRRSVRFRIASPVDENVVVVRVVMHDAAPGGGERGQDVGGVRVDDALDTRPLRRVANAISVVGDPAGGGEVPLERAAGRRMLEGRQRLRHRT